MTKAEVMHEAAIIAADDSFETLVLVAVRKDGTSLSFCSAFSNSAHVCQALVGAANLGIVSRYIRIDNVKPEEPKPP